MAKLMQICASENDLFGLDGDGVVYQYNFKTNTWVSSATGGKGARAPRPLARHLDWLRPDPRWDAAPGGGTCS
jgi:hypothetical protein